MKKVKRALPIVAEPVVAYGEPRVKIAEFKAQLSRHLQSVRTGHPLVIMDRNTPIARVEPYHEMKSKLVVHAPVQPWGSHKRSNVDRTGLFKIALQMLLEDRAKR